MRAFKKALTLLMALTLTLSASVLPAMAEPGAEAAPGASSLTLDPSTLQLTTGDKAWITATVLPAELEVGVEWRSSDPKVVSITDGEDTDYPNGRRIQVRALQAGTATITARGGQLTATCQVRVEPFMVIFHDTNGDSLGSLMGGPERMITPPKAPDLGEHAHFMHWSEELRGGTPVDFSKPITGKTNFYPQYWFDEGWVLLRAKLAHVKNAALFPKVVNHTDGRLLGFQFRQEPGYQFPQFIPVTTVNADGTIRTLQEGRDYTYEYVSGAFAVFGYNIPFSIELIGFVPPPAGDSLSFTEKVNQQAGDITQMLIGSGAGSIQGLPGVSQTVTANGTKLDVIQMMPMESGEAGIGGSLMTALGQASDTLALRFDITDGLTGGSASILMPGGFGNITEPGRVSYPMKYSATSPHEKEMLALAGDVKAYDTLLVGGNYVLPGMATLMLSTDLPAGTPVKLQHYNPDTNALTDLGDSKVDDQGKTPLSTHTLGDILIVQP